MRVARGHSGSVPRRGCGRFSGPLAASARSHQNVLRGVVERLEPEPLKLWKMTF